MQRSRFFWAISLTCGLLTSVVSSYGQAQTLPSPCQSRPVLFKDKNFRGKILEPQHSIGNLSEKKFNDEASSICVPPGWKIEFSEHQGYVGKQFVLNGPANISDLKQFHKSDKWNDKISSVKVFPPQQRKTRYGELALLWAGVIDNKEGQGGRHGPFGNLHILVYPANQTCPGNQKRYPKALRHIILPGPVNTGKKGEWDDGDQKTFQSLGLFRWRSANDAVTVFVYESDGITRATGRAHDPIFCQVMRRKDTRTPRIFSGGPTRDFLAKPDAIDAARYRATSWMAKVQSVWNGGLRQGIPAMFMRAQTVDAALTYNDQSSNVRR